VTIAPHCRLEQLAVLPTLEQHRLVLSARIGQADDAHLAAGLGAALDARDHGRGRAARGAPARTDPENSIQFMTCMRFSALA
jgi:hypothetical protein